MEAERSLPAAAKIGTSGLSRIADSVFDRSLDEGAAVKTFLSVRETILQQDRSIEDLRREGQSASEALEQEALREKLTQAEALTERQFRALKETEQSLASVQGELAKQIGENEAKAARIRALEESVSTLEWDKAALDKPAEPVATADTDEVIGLRAEVVSLQKKIDAIGDIIDGTVMPAQAIAQNRAEAAAGLDRATTPSEPETQQKAAGTGAAMPYRQFRDRLIAWTGSPRTWRQAWNTVTGTDDNTVNRWRVKGSVPPEYAGRIDEVVAMRPPAPGTVIQGKIEERLEEELAKEGRAGYAEIGAALSKEFECEITEVMINRWLHRRKQLSRPVTVFSAAAKKAESLRKGRWGQTISTRDGGDYQQAPKAPEGVSDMAFDEFEERAKQCFSDDGSWRGQWAAATGYGIHNIVYWKKKGRVPAGYVHVLSMIEKEKASGVTADPEILGAEEAVRVAEILVDEPDISHAEIAARLSRGRGSPVTEAAVSAIVARIQAQHSAVSGG